MEDFKIIAPSINTTNQRKIIWSLTLKDISLLIISNLIFSIIWIPLLLTKNYIESIVVLAISFLLSFSLIIKFTSSLKLYQIIFKYIKFIFKNKEININLIKKIENNEIIFNNNKKIVLFRIVGKDTTFITDEDFKNLSNALASFFNENNNLQIIKIDSELNLDNQINNLENLKDSNSNISDEINNLENFLFLLKEEIITNSQNKYFIVYKNNNDFDYLNQSLMSAKIYLKKANDFETKEIAKKIYCKNGKYQDNYRYLINKKNKEFSSLFIIKKFPIKANREWLSFIFNLPDCEISFIKNLWDRENAIKKIDNILLLNYENEMKFTNDSKQIESKIIDESFTQTLENIQANLDNLNSIALIIKLNAKSRKEILYKIKNLSKEFIKNKYQVNQMLFEQQLALKSFIGFNYTDEKIKEKINIDCLSSALGFGYPFVNQELIDSRGILMGLDENKNPICIDWKYRDNNKPSSSAILIGQTGSGKTTTLKRIIKNQIISNEYKIIVIDPENEYSKLITNLGGEKINLMEKKYSINPFYLNYNKENLNENILEKINFLKTFFSLIFNSNGILLQNDINEIISACYELYKEKKVEWTFTDLKKYLQKNKYKQYIIDAIKIYCSGNAFGDLFDNKNNINLKNNYVCFELKDILSKSSSLISKAQMFLILQYLNQQVFENNKDRYLNIILDEAHLLLDEKYIEITQYLCEMYKRIRKYNGMMMIATQNISDFYNKKAILAYTKPIINNSFYIIVHSIKSQEIESLDFLMKDVGGLNDKEKKYLIDSPSGSAILFFKNVRTKIKVNA